MNLRRLFLWALVASLCLTGALAIGTLLFADFDDRAARVLATTALLGLASLLGMPAGLLLDQGRGRLLAWLVLGATAAAFALAALAIWAEPAEDWVWKLAVTLGAAGAAGSQAAWSTSRLRSGDGRGVRAVYAIGILLAAALAGLIVVAVWREIEDSGYYRFLGATAVAALLATLLQPLARRVSGPRGDGVARLVFTLDRAPSPEAVERARRALEEDGVHVREVVGPRD